MRRVVTRPSLRMHSPFNTTYPADNDVAVVVALHNFLDRVASRFLVFVFSPFFFFLLLSSALLVKKERKKVMYKIRSLLRLLWCIYSVHELNFLDEVRK